VCEGLQAAHDAGVVHRDLKPDNVMLARDGRVVITDFGIARAPRRRDNLMQTGVDGLIGTPQYMAPEQVEGADDIDGRADLYAAGVMLFELLSGSSPWTGNSPVAVAIARLMNPPPTLSTPGVPGQLVDLVARAMSRHRDSRPPSARALADALRAIAADLTHDAPGELPEETLPMRDTLDPAPISSRTETTLAVLPVRNRSSEDDAHLAMGIAEELAGELAMLEGLLVKPLSASLALDASRGPQELGRQLGVRVVVDSSMRRKGDSLRVRVALISVDDGFQVWGAKFSGPVSDIFDIAEDAAEAIATALTTTHSPSARPDNISDPIAVELYMRAKRTLANDWAVGMDSAIALFEQAHARAPHDARILTGLAAAISRSAFFTHDNDAIRAAHARALGLAQRAASQAPDWADPHYALAIVSYNANDFAAAARHCQDALDLHADHLDARDLLGRILAETGPLDAAIHHLTRALQLDPHLERARWDLARAHTLSHDFDTADAILEALATQGDTARHMTNALRVRFCLWRGDTPDRDLLDDMRAFKQSHLVSSIGRTLIDEDAPFERVKDLIPAAFAEMRARATKSRFFLLELQLLVDVATWSGMYGIALDALEDVAALGVRDLMWLERAPIMIRLAEHPRYQAVVARVRRETSAARTLPSTP
jgi:serine/threonine-protein kinase